MVGDWIIGTMKCVPSALVSFKTPRKRSNITARSPPSTVKVVVLKKKSESSERVQGQFSRLRTTATPKGLIKGDEREKKTERSIRSASLPVERNPQAREMRCATYRRTWRSTPRSRQSPRTRLFSPTRPTLARPLAPNWMPFLDIKVVRFLIEPPE